MQLRDYQERAVTEVARKLASGKRKVVFQLATGGGKTVTFSTIAKRYFEKSNKSVLILVHRQELLDQAYRTLYEWYGIIAEKITADKKNVAVSDYYIGMCETVERRLKKRPNYIPSQIGLLIIDEAHIGNFKKLHQKFESAFIIGFTATPLAATKKDPLKNYFDDIVTGIDIPELIADGALCQNQTYGIKGAVDRSSLVMKGNDFDEFQMGEEFSKAKHVQNTVFAYEQYCKGQKAMIFNCNIKHSVLVMEAFINAGYDCRHVDADSENRKEIFRWFSRTPGAILCNVGITTAGFDEPTIEVVVMNRSTASLPLWLQCTGRGSRPIDDQFISSKKSLYPYQLNEKSKFTILDLGGNAVTHGDWCDSRDWKDVFINPVKPKEKAGVAPVKECPECALVMAANCRECPECGYVFPSKEEKYDSEVIELELVTKNIDVAALIEKNQGYKEYYTLFQIGNNIATQAKYKMPEMANKIAERLLHSYYEKAAEWCKLKSKKFNGWHKDTVKNHLYSQLSKSFPSWQVPQ